MPDKRPSGSNASLSTVNRTEITVLLLVMALIAGGAIAFALFA